MAKQVDQTGDYHNGNLAVDLRLKWTQIAKKHGWTAQKYRLDLFLWHSCDQCSIRFTSAAIHQNLRFNLSINRNYFTQQISPITASSWSLPMILWNHFNQLYCTLDGKLWLKLELIRPMSEILQPISAALLHTSKIIAVQFWQIQLVGYKEYFFAF